MTICGMCSKQIICQDGHTCFEKIGRAHSTQFMLGCSMGIAGCNEPSQIPELFRQEMAGTNKKRIRLNIGSTKKFSKAPVNENQCERMLFAVMHTSRHH